MLTELLYISEAVEYPAKPIDFGHILSRARQRNSDAGVTGMLIFHKGKFIQLLEGMSQGLTGIYNDYIQTDPRHKSIQVVAQGAIHARSFGAWSMGFAEPAAMQASMPLSLEKVIYQLMSDEAQKSRPSAGVVEMIRLYQQVR